MSELMTSIRIGDQAGRSDWGRKSRKEMIEEYRRIARRDKQKAEEILAASDDEFIVEQHRGLMIRHNIKRLQP